MALMPQLRLWLPAYPGAQLFAYQAGTSTKRNTYSDSALSVANANPVVADASGLFGAIFVDPALAYKFVLAQDGDTDPPASPLFSQDNVQIAALGQTLSILSKTADYVVAASDGEDLLHRPAASASAEAGKW